MKKLLVSMFGMALILTIINAGYAVDYTFSAIDHPDAAAPSGTNASDINNSGMVVGYYRDINGDVYRGFSFNGGTFTTYYVPGSLGTLVDGVNDAGTLVGYYYDGAYRMHGFIFQSGTYTTLDYPGAGHTIPADINNMGVIVGNWWNGSAYRGFIYNNGVFTAIDIPGASSTFVEGINDAGIMVGRYSDANGDHGFSLVNGVFSSIDVLNATLTRAYEINNSNKILGWYYNNEAHGYSLTGDEYEFLPDFPGTPGTVYLSINDSEQYVGTYGGGPGDKVHSFLASAWHKVAIDIMPGNDANTINLKAKTISVAILSSTDFNAVENVDQTSLTFGAAGDESSFLSCAKSARDINRDHLKDLVCTFSVKTAFPCDSGLGMLKGRTNKGLPLSGSQEVTIKPLLPTCNP